MRFQNRSLTWFGLLVCFAVPAATTLGHPATRHAAPLAASGSAEAQQSPEQPHQRALPLNRFLDSRAAGTDRQGFFYMPTAVGEDYFDGTDRPERVERHLRTARLAGVKYLRCAFSWNGIEPARGVFKWQFWDDLVSRAQKHGIRLIPYVAYTPAWAARSKQDFWRQPPSNAQLYAEFMEKIAARYRGRILSWELWNEPDLQDYWTGSAEEFAALVKLAAPAVRRGDPRTVIVLGGVSLGPTEFFRSLMRLGVAGFVDVIAMHAYPESWHEQRLEEIFENWVPTLYQMIQRSGSGVDLWLNEAGYPDYRFSPAFATQTHTHANYDYEHTRIYQATFLFKMFALALGSQKISLAGWYRIDDFSRAEKRLPNDQVHFHLGLLNARHEPKPDLAALRFFNQLFRAPTRSIEVPLKPGSRAVVEEMQNAAEVIVVGWLRSSGYGEVRDHSGMLHDRRRETVSVPLPCERPLTPQFYSVVGKPRRHRARARRGVLQDIDLKGGSVFVARVRCETFMPGTKVKGLTTWASPYSSPESNRAGRDSGIGVN
jgi:hypothetical protein